MNKTSVFILTPKELAPKILASDFDEVVRQSKLAQFINIVGACEFTIHQNDVLPEHYQCNNFEVFFIDLYNPINNRELSEQIAQLSKQHKVIFFNADNHVFDENKALLAKVSGVFYRDDRPNVVLKGIECITHGELWFKKATKDNALQNFIKVSHQARAVTTFNQANVPSSNTVIPLLTKREKTIVSLVSSGAKNQEIADELHISPNTVKTHIYSIFRKTSSRNRIELIAWSMQLTAEYA